jgi:hypothetical protein
MSKHMRLCSSVSTHGTHFKDQKVNHRIGRPNADIQLFCSFVDCHFSVLKDQSHSSSFYAAVVGQPKGSASVTLVQPFLNISVHSYTTLWALFPYWAHVQMTLCPPERQIVTPPPWYSQVLLPFRHCCIFWVLTTFPSFLQFLLIPYSRNIFPANM